MSKPVHTASGFPIALSLSRVAQACTLLCLGAAGSIAAAQTATSAATLPEVTVKAAAESPESLPRVAPGGQVAQGSRLGLLGNVAAMDAPFNTASYTAEGMANSQATTLGSVLRHDPGVRTTTNEGHIVENFSIRGFAVNAGATAINGVYGVAPEHSVPVEIFERVELIKGPAAMLMGMPSTGDIGGAINLVPKRAGEQPLTRLTTTLSSKSNVQVHADVARRLGEEQRLGIRVNGVLSGGETWLDEQTRSRRVGHVALDYRGESGTVEADFFSSANKVRKGVVAQPILSGWTTVPKAPDGSTNFFYGENVYSNTDAKGAVLRGERKFNAAWSGFGSVGAVDNRYDGFIFGTRPVWTANAVDGSATGTVYNSWGKYSGRTAEAGVRGVFNTGGVAHRLTLAANYFKYEGGGRGNGTSPIVSNVYHPVPVTMPAGAPASTYTPYNDDVMTALSVIDSLSMAEDKVQLTLGLRAQQVEQKLAGYKENALTPLVGVVVKPWGEGVSLYGNYIEGLSAGTTVSEPYTNAGESFEPYKSKQLEFGVKWLSGALTQGLSLFQITKPALIEVGTEQKPEGEQRNRGLEWSVSGEVAPGVALLGGVSLVDAVQTKTARGLNQGRKQIGVPKLQANLGLDWKFAGVPGLALMGRINHSAAQWLTGDNSVKLPAWTTVDVGARYATRFGTTPVTLKAMVTNAADKAYFEGIWGAGRVNVGAPRAVHLAASFDF